MRTCEEYYLVQAKNYLIFWIVFVVVRLPEQKIICELVSI